VAAPPGRSTIPDRRSRHLLVAAAATLKFLRITAQGISLADIADYMALLGIVCNGLAFLGRRC
jgi:hypothetical protein